MAVEGENGVVPEPNSDGTGPAEDSGLLTQADLDALMKDFKRPASRIPNLVPAPDVSQPQPDVQPQLLSNDDLDALIGEFAGRMKDEPAAPDEASPVDKPSSSADQKVELLSNDDLDELFKQFRNPSQAASLPEAEPGISDGGGVETNQAAPPVTAPTGPAEPVADGLLTKDDLEELLKAASAAKQPASPPAAAPQPAAEAVLSETDPGEPASAQESSAPSEPASNELLSNDDIEALLKGMAAEKQEVEPTAEPTVPAPEAPASDSEILSNDDIEALLKAAAEPEIAAPSLEPTETAVENELVSNDDIAALLAEAAASNAPGNEPAAVESAAAPEEDESVSSVDIKALLATAESSEGAAEPKETEAAANSSDGEEPEPVPQDVLDALLRQVESAEPAAEAAEEGEELPALPKDTVLLQPADEPAPPQVPDVPEPAPRPAKRAKPKRRLPRLPYKLIASLAAGLLAGNATYALLSGHPYRPATDATIASLIKSDPAAVLATARHLIELKEYAEAAKTLDRALKSMPSGRLREDAQLARLDAEYRMLPSDASIPRMEAMRLAIDKFVAASPEHGGVPDALLWKADLLQRGDAAEGAYDTYYYILRKFPDFEKTPLVLGKAAETALASRRPEEAVDLLRDLMARFPDSETVLAARLQLGDALVATGDKAGARAVYLETARAYPNSAMGAEAYARLSGMSFDEGNFVDCVQLLEARLRTATKVEGNDRIYLMLAKAHRALGDNVAAERVLRELVNFFPDSAQVPAAMVMLSQALDQQGRRYEAVLLAKQAAQQFGRDPEVLENAAHFLAETGDAAGAAKAYTAAADAGSEDPDVLLSAARQFKIAGSLEESLRAYERLEHDFGMTPAAQEGGVEMARVLYDRGEVRKALERLESLSATVGGAEQRVKALSTLAALYADLGLRERAVELYREMGHEASEPNLLAEAAVALLDAGQLEDGLTIAQRVDPEQLSGPTAYRYLMRHGEALLKSNAEQGLQEMEKAYQDFAQLRTPQDEQKFIEAMLALDRTAAVRALVMDLDARVKKDPVDAPRLLQAAILWGDYLYRRGDNTGAAEAYGVGAAVPAEESPEHTWCVFQRGNALLKLGDLSGCLPLLEEVAGSKSEWQAVAQTKAAYVKAEMRRRGIPVPEPPQEASADKAKEG